MFHKVHSFSSDITLYLPSWILRNTLYVSYTVGERPELRHFYLIKWDNNGKEDSLRLNEEMSYKWHELGIIFGVPGGVLIGFRKQHQSDEQECLREVLMRWRNQGSQPFDSYPVNWPGFIKALENIGLKPTANMLIYISPPKEDKLIFFKPPCICHIHNSIVLRYTYTPQL